MRSSKPRLMIEGHKEVLDKLKALRARIGSRKLVWIHAASLGEFEQGRPLIERLRRDNPDIAVLLTFFSPSGYEVRKNYSGAEAVCYLPFDTPANARDFIKAASPDLVIFVKYEFWGNFLMRLKRAGIPTILVSAIFRESQPFFKRWGSTFRKMIHCYTHIFVQDEHSRQLLEGIGVDNVTVAGDTRFDRVTDTLRNATPIVAIERWIEEHKGSKCFVAGSSWEPDEDLFIPMLDKNPSVLAIIAPHEFDKDRIQKLKERLGKEKTVTYSEIIANGETVPEGVTRIVIDCFGLLASLYRYATVAYIGGGFGSGIHNVPEAAVYGVPVIFGPKHHKFREAGDLIACGGGFSISTADDLNRIADKLINDPQEQAKAGKAAGDYIAESIGATQTIVDMLSGDLNILPSATTD